MLEMISIAAKVYAAFYMALFIHEMGHYLAHRWLGVPVYKMRVGTRIFLTFKLGKTKFEFGIWPTDGAVIGPQRHPKRNRFIQYGSGPLANLAAIPFCLLMPADFAWYWVAAHCWLFGRNMVPEWRGGSRKYQATDGFVFWEWWKFRNWKYKGPDKSE